MFLSLSTFTGCGSTFDAVDDDQAAEGVDQPDKVTLSKGSTYQFHRVVSYAKGMTKEVSRDSDTVGNTSDAEAATVSKDGMVSAIRDGGGSTSRPITRPEGQRALRRHAVGRLAA